MKLGSRLVLILVVALVAARPTAALAQEGTRGFGTPKTQTNAVGTRRALLIGISNYQYVKDLGYAARDAQAFYAFLRSPAGGSVDSINIRLLTDSGAKNDAITEGLTWLLEKSQPNDEVIFYFAGHGDISMETVDSIGYLLPYDALTERRYFRRAALPVSDLARFIDGIHKKEATVMVFTDACRSGKLVGDVAGAYQTTAALRQYWSGVYKLVSSGEQQLSQEGPQWGNGHGVFTYYLLAGLGGRANENRDSIVTFGEVARFVEASVVAATRVDATGAPQQVPNTVGTSERALAWLAGSPVPTAAATRGARGNDAEPVDSAVQRSISAFRAAITTGNLVEPAGASAWDLYEQLRATAAAQEQLADVLDELRDALLTEAQEVIADYMAPAQVPPSSERVRRAGIAMARVSAPPFTGKTSPQARKREAQTLFLEGLAFLEGEEKSTSEKALSRLRQSIALQPTAYAYTALGFALLELNQLDSSRQAFREARERAPASPYPALGLGLVALEAGDPARALALVDSALASSPQQSTLQLGRAMALLDLGRRADALAAFRRAQSLDPALVRPGYLPSLLRDSPSALARTRQLQALLPH
jgi:tetratricopeptide (TPR) repeat protein